MGAVKRQVYNQSLMEASKYTDIRSLKHLVRNLNGLEKLAEKGDSVASSILTDLKTCLGYYRRSESMLNDKQLQVIKLNLVHGIPQEEVAEMMGLSQHTISHHISVGLKKLRKQLLEGSGQNGD